MKTNEWIVSPDCQQSARRLQESLARVAVRARLANAGRVDTYAMLPRSSLESVEPAGYDVDNGTVGLERLRDHEPNSCAGTLISERKADKIASEDGIARSRVARTCPAACYDSDEPLDTEEALRVGEDVGPGAGAGGAEAAAAGCDWHGRKRSCAGLGAVGVEEETRRAVDARFVSWTDAADAIYVGTRLRLTTELNFSDSACMPASFGLGRIQMAGCTEPGHWAANWLARSENRSPNLAPCECALIQLGELQSLDPQRIAVTSCPCPYARELWPPDGPGRWEIGRGLDGEEG